MSDTIIRVENLGKKYLIKHQQQGSYTALRDVITDKVKSLGKKIISPWDHKQSSTYSTTEEFWAIKDISFKVKQGEVVGIIGRNGAGKSTLLKIISRITEPTKGRIRINGRVASLLEVGTGFHPELTGRENVFLNGAILGMGKAEIKRKFDEIVAFAEIEKFLDTPVKRYSSGMYVRLAFAVAAHLEPEILLVDEVLAVGDAAFQKKCLGKMGDVAKEGRTVLFVSHNMGAIRNLCQRVLVLYEGTVRADGETEAAIDQYLSEFANGNNDSFQRKRRSNALAWFTDVRFESSVGRTTSVISGGSLNICLEYETAQESLFADWGITIYNMWGESILHFGSIYSLSNKFPLKRKGIIVCHVPRFPLPEGRYRVNTSLHIDGKYLDHMVGAAHIDVYKGDFYGTGRTPPPSSTKVYVEHTWRSTMEEK